MVCYPEVQKEAQAELDNVLSGRLPEHNDIFSLPYLSALVKEVYRYDETCSLLQEFNFFILNMSVYSRWESVTPLGRLFFFPIIDGNRLRSLFREGAPHLSTADDIYHEYHIPANSLVIANQW